MGSATQPSVFGILIGAMRSHRGALHSQALIIIMQSHRGYEMGHVKGIWFIYFQCHKS